MFNQRLDDVMDETTQNPIDDTTTQNLIEVQNESLMESEDELGGNSGCRLHCLINLEEGNSALCNNSEVDDLDDTPFFEDPFDDSGIKFDLDTVNRGI